MPDDGPPGAGTCADPLVFERLLAGSAQDWHLLEADPSGCCARFRFTGAFQGARVIWDCTLTTLAAARAPRNFIDVGPADGAVRAIRVGLDLPAIDAATIRKTIVMIRQYRLLAPGLHEYGDPRA